MLWLADPIFRDRPISTSPYDNACVASLVRGSPAKFHFSHLGPLKHDNYSNLIYAVFMLTKSISYVATEPLRGDHIHLSHLYLPTVSQTVLNSQVRGGPAKFHFSHLGPL